MANQSSDIELSIVMPCLNEAETLAICIRKAKKYMEENNIVGEIIVADNGSTDGSKDIAINEGAKLIEIDKKGYGNALIGGIEAAQGKYIVMGDADDSYDFSNLDLYINKLREGYDLIMGNRFLGGIKKGAMPFLHRYLGNPVLSAIGRLFFKNKVGDFHCGLRGFNREAIRSLNLQTGGMEFASEMVVKATLNKLKIAEVPTTLSPDGRNRAPHLNTWQDGWRHLRFLLLYSPRWLFLYPGLFSATVGLIFLVWLSIKPQTIAGITLDIHTMVYATALILLGLQAVIFALFSYVFTVTNKLLPRNDHIVSFLANFTLEKGLMIGLFLVAGGFAGSIYAVVSWSGESFGQLVPTSMMRIVIPSITAVIAGVQTILAGFFVSILMLPIKK